MAQDIASCGHRVDATVFIECYSMYRASGPDHLKPVGETQFAVGQATMAAIVRYTSCRIVAGIVAFADMQLGDLVDELLDAHLEAGNGRVRGIRQRAKGTQIRG